MVPEPGNPQALNRFSYVLNNPLKYTDPTGHWVNNDWIESDWDWQAKTPWQGKERGEAWATYYNRVGCHGDNGEGLVMAAAAPFIGVGLIAGGELAYAGASYTASKLTPLIPPALERLKSWWDSVSESGIRIPGGIAKQSTSEAAMAARAQVEAGTRLYRIGTTGISKAGEAQFWALEHPLSPGYIARYGIPPQNVAEANFIETAILRLGTAFVTRIAPPVWPNPGGGIEVVVPEGGVILQGFSIIR